MPGFFPWSGSANRRPSASHSTRAGSVYSSSGRDGHDRRHDSSSSFFSALGGGGGRESSSHHHHSSSGHHYASSRSGGGGSSYYKRRPRDGFIQRLIYRMKHLLRELWYYMRRNPVKVFFVVIMPLISGGVLAGVAKQFGIRLPGFLMGKQGGSFGSGGGGGYYGSHGYDRHHESGGMGGGLGGLGSIAEGLSGGGGMGSLMSVAKMFM